MVDSCTNFIGYCTSCGTLPYTPCTYSLIHRALSRLPISLIWDKVKGGLGGPPLCQCVCLAAVVWATKVISNSQIFYRPFNSFVPSLVFITRCLIPLFFSMIQKRLKMLAKMENDANVSDKLSKLLEPKNLCPKRDKFCWYHRHWYHFFHIYCIALNWCSDFFGPQDNLMPSDTVIHLK